MERLNFIVEKETIWQRLKHIDKPIVIYGMGDGALKIFDKCQKYGIEIEAMFASDEFVRGQSFNGYRVERYSDICEKYDDFVVLLAFGAFEEGLLNKIYSIASEHELLAPDLPLFSDECVDFDYIEKNAQKLERAYKLLADEQSRKVFADQINYKLSGKIDYLKNSETKKEEVFKNIFSLTEDESFLDLGAYDGDTVREFIDAVKGKYRAICAVEPDVKNFRKLENNIAAQGIENCDCLNIGIWDKQDTMSFQNLAGRMSSLSLDDSGKKIRPVNVDTIDNISQGRDITLIKMDVEGVEEQALKSGKNTLNELKPKLMVSAYHKTSDFFELVLLINELEPDYKIYLRHHPYIPAWETNIYCTL